MKEKNFIYPLTFGNDSALPAHSRTRPSPKLQKIQTSAAPQKPFPCFQDLEMISLRATRVSSEGTFNQRGVEREPP